jgi:protein phosphatase
MDEKKGVFVLADGMGGHAAGEVASGELVSGIIGFFTEKELSAFTEKELNMLVNNSIRTVNEKIFNIASQDDSRTGMGTTAVVLLFSKKRYHVGWVGDSRLYLYRKEKLKRVTRDHSKVQMLVDAGIIRPDEAFSHPERNVILKAVGTKNTVECRGAVRQNKKGDFFMLCSDGVLGELTRFGDRNDYKLQERASGHFRRAYLMANAKGAPTTLRSIVIKNREL